MMRLTIPLSDSTLLTPYVRSALDFARELSDDVLITPRGRGLEIVGQVEAVGRPTMRPWLEVLTRINQELIRRGLSSPLYAQPRTRYQVEPPGREDWDPGDLVERRGWGDCEDLASKRAADLREAGEDDARADSYPSRTREDGTRVWHAITVRDDDTIEDPSAALGMPVRRRHLPDGTPFAVVVERARREHDATMGVAPLVNCVERGRRFAAGLPIVMGSVGSFSGRRRRRL